MTGILSMGESSTATTNFVDFTPSDITRDRILAVASQLFAQARVHPVGINRIAIAPSLNLGWRTCLQTTIEQLAPDPRSPLGLKATLVCPPR